MATNEQLEKLKTRINTPGEFEQVVYVVSHPRSGNTYTRYILESIIRFKSYGYIGSGHLESVDNIGVLQDKPEGFFDSSGIIRKRHGFYKEMELQTSPQKVIFLLRNPIDMKVRDRNQWSKEEWTSQSWKFYMRLVKQYLEHDKFPKTILLYEDLVANPEESTNKLLQFLEFDTNEEVLSRKRAFFDNIDEHVSISRERTPESYKAEPMSWSSEQLTEADMLYEWKELERKVRKDYPEAIGSLEFVRNLYKDRS